MEITTAVLEQVRTLWDYHRIDDKVQKADLIFCLGSLDIRSAQRAAELYLENLSETVMFSGGIAHVNDLLRTTWSQPEAVVFANEAMRLGVPQENILLEPEAANTGENITKGFEVLRRAGKEAKSMILVQKPYMVRRTFATFKKQWPGEDVKIMVTSPKISFEKYFDVDDAEKQKIINIMVGDLDRIKQYPEKGFQIYQEIPEYVTKAFEFLVNEGYTSHLIK